MCLSCDVNSMAMLACFESGCIRLGLSHTEDSPQLWSWHNGKRQLLFYFLSHTHTQASKLSLSMSSSLILCLSVFLFYISVTSAFLLCSPCQLPFHAPPQKFVQVNISRLLMLKGSGGGRYVTGRELSVPRAATDKTETLFFPRYFYLLNNGYV